MLIALLLIPFSSRFKKPSEINNYVARVKIEEIIEYNIEKINKLVKIEDEGSIKAVVLHVNSPGGTIGGSEAYYRVLKRIAAKKPLVVVMDEVAASGGYLVSLPASRIFALDSTMTGSIGVFSESIEVTELANKIGLTPIVIKSSELKNTPNPLEKLSEKAQKNLEASIHESCALFKEWVRNNRKLSDAQFAEATNGAVFIGRKAKQLGLVDQIGDESDALAWLKKEKKIDLEVIDYTLEKSRPELEMLLKKFQSAIKNVISSTSSKLMTVI